MNEDLFEALLEVDMALQKAEGVFGAAPTDRKERVRRAIIFLQKHICPHKEEIMEISRSRGVEISLLVTEIIVFFLGGAPGLSLIGREISELGLENFCRDPYGTLGAMVDVPE